MTLAADNAALAATQRTTWVDANVTDTARTAAAALADGTDPAHVAEWLFVETAHIARVAGPVDGDVWARYIACLQRMEARRGR